MSALHLRPPRHALTHEIEIKRSRFITTLARTDTPEEARELIDAVKAKHPQAAAALLGCLIDPPDAAPLQHSSDDRSPQARQAPRCTEEALRASDTWNATAVVTATSIRSLLGRGGLVRAYSPPCPRRSPARPIAPPR